MLQKLTRHFSMKNDISKINPSTLIRLGFLIVVFSMGEEDGGGGGGGG